MFRALATVLFVATLTAPAALACHGHDDTGPAQLIPSSARSVSDQFDAHLGPKYVRFHRAARR